MTARTTARSTAPSTTSRVAAWLALALCVLVWGAVLVVPFVTTSSSVSSGGAVTKETNHQTLVASEGVRLLAVLAIPVLIAGLGLLAARIGRGALLTATALMLAWVTITGLSVGVLYLPAALALGVALASWQQVPGDFQRGARKASYASLALVVAALVSWALSGLLRLTTGYPNGVAGVLVLVANVLVFGFTTATVYTYLAEGGKALRKVLLPGRRVAPGRESASTR